MLIRFECPHCGQEIEDEVESAVYDISGERESEREGFEVSEIECQCGKTLVVNVTARAGGKCVDIDGFPEIEPEFEDTDHSENYWYDDFLENYDPSDAHEVYLQSLSELKTLETPTWLLGIPNQALLRVMYLQYVVILEAYLSDRLINIIMDDSDKLLALISQVDVLNKQSLTLIEILKEPDIVRKTVKGFLQRVSFHDLMRVSHFYDVVLGVYIFSEAPLSSELRKKREAQRKQKSGEAAELTPAEEEMMSIIQTRHHLVHRNGRTNEGNPIQITVEDVGRVQQLVVEMVDRVEQAYSEYITRRASDDSGKPKF